MALKFSKMDRIIHPSSCFVCRWAGNDNLLFWPHEYYQNGGEWRGFLKNNGDPDAPRSKHVNIEVCMEHSTLIWRAWVIVVQDEVNFHTAYYNWLDRIER